MPGNLGEFLGSLQNAQVFGKFSKQPIIWKIFKIYRIYHPQISIGICEILGSPNAWESGKFSKCLGIWEISQLPRFMELFPKYPIIWEIFKILKIYHPQIPKRNLGNLGNSPIAWESGKFPKQCIFQLRKFPNFPNTQGFLKNVNIKQ